MDAHERASVERRVSAIKQAIYELALERADRLRALTSELRELRRTLESHSSFSRHGTP